jgi:hypothetical protein
VDVSKRDEMLANFSASSGHLKTHPPAAPKEDAPSEPSSDAIPIRSRSGYLRKFQDGKYAEFYGATSFFQISPSDDQDPATIKIPQRSAPNRYLRNHLLFQTLFPVRL